MGSINESYYTLSKIIEYDIKPELLIYNTFLKPISNYKANPL